MLTNDYQTPRHCDCVWIESYRRPVRNAYPMSHPSPLRGTSSTCTLVSSRGASSLALDTAMCKAAASIVVKAAAFGPKGSSCHSNTLPALVRTPPLMMQSALDVKPFMSFSVDTASPAGLFPNFNTVSTPSRPERKSRACPHFRLPCISPGCCSLTPIGHSRC
ncbi:hypothetical protein Z043_105306 [Scleropages formosus]|uniref:Uncharacterized protein n=1 Tax=Scleropages formosus TaxID=113540 RepID=A0A0P7XGW9_SCLFO|nr:hypothetical protein Z043_105306 [Scleropages formosus]